MGGPSGSWEFAYEEDVRMSRVPWNFGDGPTVSGDVHEVILHEGSDSFGGLALERGAQCGQVQMTVEAAELLAGLDHAGGAPAQRHLPVAPALDVA
jgi:hypothetical protein